jgi:very-short-patch-repair endonuclease
MGAALKRLAIAAVPQYPIARAGRNTGRFYYLDFAVPKLMLAIECDGAAWHSTRGQQVRDKRRQTEIEAMGWRFVRFTGSQIVSDMVGCEKELTSLCKGKPNGT